MKSRTEEIDLAVALAANRARGAPRDGLWHVTPISVGDEKWPRSRARHRVDSPPLLYRVHRSLRRLVTMADAFTHSYPLQDGSTLTIVGTITPGTPPPPPPPPPPPSDVNQVSVGATTHALSGTNIDRLAEALVRYQAPLTITATNEWGCEVVVLGGRVTAVNDRQPTRVTTGTAIPAGGYVLSGHGTSRDWLLANATVGAIITLGKGTIPPPVPTGGKTLAIYHMMWSGNPTLVSIPSSCNEVRLAFAQGSPPALVGWGGESQSQFVADAAALRARGVRIVVSVGGSGGSVNIADHALFLAGIDNIRTQLGGNLDGIDWDLEAVSLNTSDCLTIVMALKARYGAGFRNSFAPNGGNVGQYLPAAVACQNAGVLDSYGQQFYDAPVSVAEALGRVNEAISAGIPASKITIGMMIASDSSHWTNAQCVANYTQLLAAVPNLNGAYLWEHSRLGTGQWAQEVGRLVFA